MSTKNFIINPILGLFLFFTGIPSIHALGTRAKGWMYVEKVKKLESRGIFFDSWEGIFQVVSYDKHEKCDKKNDECFTPVSKDLHFSINKKNTKVTEYLRQQDVEGNFLIQYRKHKFEKISLSTKFEILDIVEITPAPPADFPRKMAVKKTGYRNLTVDGEILDLSNQGWCIKTYEGLYRDRKTGKVVPFSVTQKSMAEYIFSAMKSKAPYNMGVSRALVKGFRKSHNDIFEINYDEKPSL